MVFPWEFLVFVVGVVYGYVQPGKQDKMALLGRGVLLGLIVAVVVAVLGLLLGARPFAVGEGFIGIVFDAVLLTLFFVAGAFVGDWIEGRNKATG